MGLQPKLRARLTVGLDSNFFPPRGFVATAMNLAMMTAAQWDSEFIAHFAAERWALREAKVVGVRRLSAADQTRLLGDEPDVISIADPPRLREGKHALIDGVGPPLPNRPEKIARGAQLQTLRHY